jgi:hypothetical protein
MKLFTEEQVIKLTKSAFVAGQNHNSFILSEELEKTTPIEILTDEDIKGYIKSIPYYGHCTSEYCEGIEDGIKWTLDKIQGGNK